MESSSSSSLDSNLRFDLYAVLVGLGLAGFLAVCFWRLYKLTVSARPQDMMPTATATATTSDAGRLKTGALRQQDVAALPVFVVRGRGAGADDGCAAAPSVECAVCLAEIGDGETGRLLPGCGHRFHVACIDRWFRANSTCPLCRAAAVGEQQGAVETCKAAASAQEQVAVVVQS
ncbi:hypothetical protein BDA96_01G402700 [Sorghum bicolor]|jgi:hypothetical protein|uniref:RING-type domain-containing protein n=2 Tax=Sorghum bicolor TaxID=4558 RepID=A0A921S350_SORBI|nr:RING-H2 finger protein ATL2 [Sorghum bicolor]EER94886.1 hypothetical protein SORBI_3001G378500 [Sorghum bicolor]KAG0551198.1 hypothetical protein BDA96_01G402700 [Sorghum bicolor]|eukprot:XP_002467888.1 RING-H2 finger protein ATL2 [Sorghum bicolor]